MTPGRYAFQPFQHLSIADITGVQDVIAVRFRAVSDLRAEQAVGVGKDSNVC
jgi:hypothetical protein